MGKPASHRRWRRGFYVITSATITIEVDDVRRTVNLIVSGDEGRAKDVAKAVLEKLAAEGEPESFRGREEHETH
jgi:hypothetical protein